MDFAAIALAELGSISERRTYLLLEGHDGLPKLLMHDTGVNSGFMIPQYTAAALVSENKILCHPASVDSIPTSLGQEDHVSMGSISAFKLLAVLRNVERVLAVELLTSAQALDFREALTPGHGECQGPRQSERAQKLLEPLQHPAIPQLLVQDLVCGILRGVIAEPDLVGLRSVARGHGQGRDGKQAGERRARSHLHSHPGRLAPCKSDRPQSARSRHSGTIP